MRLLQHIASMLLLIGLLCPATQAAGQPDPLADESARRAAANWRDVLARIDSDVQLPTRARQQRASCCGSLSLVANARVAPDSERSIVR